METIKPTIDELWTALTKHCSLCGHDQNREEFPVVRRHGKWVAGSWCKPCCRDRKKRYYAKNTERLIAYSAQYVAEHKEETRKSRKRYRSENEEAIRQRKKLDYQKNKAKRYASGRRWAEKNKDRLRKQRTDHMREKRRSDPQTNMRSLLRSRVAHAVRDQGARKHAKTMEMVGCSIHEFMDHIESLWLLGMNWQNRGRGRDKWHIDHIRPCASFDLTDPEQQKQCFHWSNMQPLWEIDNLSKGSKYENEQSR